MCTYVLGLDLGPNSIGWAMFEQDPKTKEIVGFLETESRGHPPMGVRIFEAGLQNFDTGKEASLNQSRRQARSMRRNHSRRNARRRQLRDQLMEIGLLPSEPAALEDLYRTNPYQLRARAIVEDVPAHELGRALYHLGQRRGFKSNRKSGQSKDDEGILKEIGILEKAMKDADCATLGEYLHRSTNGTDPRRQRIRGQHTRRDMYAAEFEAIVERQLQAHGSVLTDEVVDNLRQTIFFQHPFAITEERRERAPSRANLHRAPSVRPCPLEPEEMCAPRAAWEAQQFRILKEVANLRITEGIADERDLNADERDLIVEYLSPREKAKFSDLRRELAKSGIDPEARFNLERGGRTTIQGNSVESKLAVAFGRAKWKTVDEATRVRLREMLTTTENRSDLRDELATFDLKDEKLSRLVSWHPPDGHLGYSLAAIRKLLPLMLGGADEYDAIAKAYPERPEAAELDRLPALSSRDLPVSIQQLTNPVVRRALVELRKVINALVREHGRPARVVIEMAREMKAGTERRRDYNKMIRQREKERIEAAVRVEEFGGNPRYRSDINRWLYWKEQGGVCLYTGRAIEPSELFRGAEWEVDHILPRWQSLDDSMGNKVLVHRGANKDKGDRTPAGWLGEDSEEFSQMLRRAKSLVDEHKLPYGKYKRLCQKEVATDEFAQRQLNDTRYLTRLVAEYLALLYPPELRRGQKAIQTCRGGLTAELRRQWGLNNLLSPLYNADGKPVMSTRTSPDGEPLKSRADHRHHAIDAVVVALSSRGILKRYQDYWKRRTANPDDGRPDFPKPWAEFMSDVKMQASRINVSHRAQRKIAGAFHEETFYGPARNRSGEIVADRFVMRKPLASLTGRYANNIRDASVRGIVHERLAARGWDGKANPLPKDWHKPELSMSSGVPIRKVRIEVPIKNPLQLKHRYAQLGNNHHMEVVASQDVGADGRPKKMWGAIVPTIEAATRLRRRHEPVVQREHGPDKQFIMSLTRKDTVEVMNPTTGERLYCVVQTMSGSQTLSSTIDLFLRDARDSRPASEGNKAPFKRLKSFKSWSDLGIRKVQIDPIGRIAPAND